MVCLLIHVDHLEDDRGAGWGPAREGALILDKVSVPSGSAMISVLSFNSRDSLGVIRLVSFCPGVLSEFRPEFIIIGDSTVIILFT